MHRRLRRFALVAAVAGGGWLVSCMDDETEVIETDSDVIEADSDVVEANDDVVGAETTEADDDVVEADVPALITPPRGTRADCVAAGWDWYRDMATHYCPHPFPNDLSDCPPPEATCFCALTCETDADCAGTTLPQCLPVLWFGGSDAGGCSYDFKVCSVEPPRFQVCEYPERARRCN